MKFTRPACKPSRKAPGMPIIAKPSHVVSAIRIAPDELCREFQRLNLEFVEVGGATLNAIVAEPEFIQQIRAKQVEDAKSIEIRAKILEGKAAGFEVDASDMLRFRGRLYVPDDVDLRKAVLSEAHDTPYSVHPGGDKMYQDLRLQFWWPNMRGEIAAYVSRCLTCQQVKFDHKRPGGLLQPLEIPMWKWESISMDFVMALPKTVGGKDAV